MPRSIKFRELCKLEPKLEKLYNKAKAVNRQKPMPCANEVWYGYGAMPRDGGLRRQVYKLVGWSREDDPKCDSRLKTREAYDVAYETIYKVLPDCDERCCYSDE